MTLRWSLVLTLAMVASCARPETKRDTDLVRDFVQEFYDWYVPLSGEISSGRPAEIALQRRAAVFDASLARELKEDFDAQAKADEIVDLDFDPFLAAQDPCERYEVVTVRAEAVSYG